MKNKVYSKMDRKIDDYLGTRNLRPGPPARLINKILEGSDKTDPLVPQRINFSSFSLPLGRNIPWTELSSVKKNVYGSEPAYFLEFLNSKLLILKITNEIPLYYFGSLMAKCLGIKTPNCRIVEYKDPEFNIMMDNLERASHSDPGINNKIIHEVKNCPFVLLYEYIPALSLFELGTNRSEILLRDKNFKSRELMINLGKILGLDIFLNNNKRLPFVWLNNGDPNNIIFKVIMDLLPPGADFKNQSIIEIFLENVYVLDTYPCILDPNDKVMLRNLGDYLNSLGEFFKLMCYEFKSICIYGKDLSSFQFHSFDKLVSMFKNTTDYTLSPENLFHISMGILIMINEILDIDMESFEKLLKYVVKDAISKDWADNYKQYAKTIKMEYFTYIMDFFKKIKDDNDQIFSWIEEITFGIYQTKPSDDIPKIVKKHKKFRYDYEELKKKAKEGDVSEISDKSKKKKSKNEENLPIDEKLNKDKKLDKGAILERDGFGPVGPEYKGKKNIRDFFNFNKNDKSIFKNDVHNGVYEIAELTNDMIMDLKDRVYNEIYEKPPIPTDIKQSDDDDNNNNGDDDEKKKKLFKPTEDFNPDHAVLTTDELKNKIKKEELYGTLQTKKNYNKEEAEYLEKKIKQVDPGFEKRIKREIEEEQEKDKKLKLINNDEVGNDNNDGEFKNIKPKKRRDTKTSNKDKTDNSLSKSKESKKSKSKKETDDVIQVTGKSGKSKGTSKSKSKKQETKSSKVTKSSKRSKKSKKKTESDEEEENEDEEEEEDDE